LRGYLLAAYSKRFIGLQVIVLAPALDIAPTDRGVLGAADLKRQFEFRVWEMPVHGMRLAGTSRMPRIGRNRWSHDKRSQ
jgi:hypothetical protein